MVAITFGVLSFVACMFLTYVFVHLQRELVGPLKIEKRSAGESALTYIGSYRTHPDVLPVEPAPHAGEWQQAKAEAVGRRETLIGGAGAVRTLGAIRLRHTAPLAERSAPLMARSRIGRKGQPVLMAFS
jgi:hypothetical protein